MSPDMSPASMRIAGVLFVLVPTIAFGGASLLWMIRSRLPGYLDNPLRQALFRAGHAHAGVLVMLALVGLLYVDGAALAPAAKRLVRSSLAFAPILVSAGFFLSVASPRATRPGKLIGLVYLGFALLTVGTVTLGVGMLRAG
ncbi:hypothetical protein BH24DEI1_BH24DEI1_17820 [soil metagenome]